MVCMDGVKILLVEDESIEALDIKRTLESFGYNIPYVASTGEEAVEKAREIIPDLILMDIILKGDTNGIEAVKQIKNLNIPVVYLTAHSEEITFQKALKTGPYGYVLKPFNRNELKYSIEMALFKHRMEQELKESNDKFKLLTETIDDIIYVIDLKNQKISYISSAVEKITGWNKESFYEDSDLWMEMILPEDRPRIRSYVSKIIGEKKGESEFNTKKLNYRIQTKDGKVKWLSESFKIIFDENEEALQVIGHAADVTQEKESEKRYKESEKKYRTLFEFNPDYTILVALNGNILDVNDAAADFMGLTKDDLIGKKFGDIELFPEEDVRLHMGKFSQALKGQEVEPYQYPIIDKNGVRRWAEAKVVPLKLNDDINSILVIATDITDRKNATDKLKSSLKEKEVLINEIHHRVKNNMQIISSLLNLQKQHVIDDEVAVDVLKESQNRIRAMAMIQEKLYQSDDFSHIKFYEYIESVVSDLFYSYNIHKDQVKLRVKVEDIYLNMETGIPCGLIISELVSNSLKHAFPDGRKGEVCISLKISGDEYELIVSDNGIGLPENIDYKNTDSLGLQLVNNLVNQLDGKITLERGQGTKFKISFKKLKYKIYKELD